MNRRDFISGIGITSIAAALPLESLLAQEARFTYPLALRGDDLASRFRREGNGLQFKVTDLVEREQKTGGFKPFYEVPERLPYRVYFDLDRPRFL